MKMHTSVISLITSLIVSNMVASTPAKSVEVMLQRLLQLRARCMELGAHAVTIRCWFCNLPNSQQLVAKGFPQQLLRNLL